MIIDATLPDSAISSAIPINHSAAVLLAKLTMNAATKTAIPTISDQ
jgi:hypothetical protein